MVMEPKDLPDLGHILEILERAHGSKDRRRENIEAFQRLIWNQPRVLYSDVLDEALGDLAYDLEFFIADAANNGESTPYEELNISKDVARVIDLLKSHKG